MSPPRRLATTVVERVPWWAMLSAAAAPVVLVGGWTYAASLQPARFDPVRMGVSDLAALDSPSRWPMTIAIVALAFCQLVTAKGLRSADVAGRGVLAFGGVALLLVAWLPNNTMGKSFVGHVLPTELAFGALALWPALSARDGVAVPWPLGRRISVAVSVVMFALIVYAAVGLILDSDDFGLRERIVYVAQASWPFVVAAATNLSPATRAPAAPFPPR